MKVRNAIAVVSATALALSLAACSSDPALTTEPPAQLTPAEAPQSPGAEQPGGQPAPTKTPEDVKIRAIQDGFVLETVAGTLRQGFPSFAEKTDAEIETILNAGCDAMEASGAPESGADAIRTYGIEAYDAAFSLTASIQLYCPEFTKFLGRS